MVSDAVLIALITSIPPTIATIAAAWFQRKRARKLQAKLDSTHNLISHIAHTDVRLEDAHEEIGALKKQLEGVTRARAYAASSPRADG